MVEGWGIFGLLEPMELEYPVDACDCGSYGHKIMSHSFSASRLLRTVRDWCGPLIIPQILSREGFLLNPALLYPILSPPNSDTKTNCLSQNVATHNKSINGLLLVPSSQSALRCVNPRFSMYPVSTRRSK